MFTFKNYCILIVFSMIFTSGSTVFATSPDDQVVGAFESTGLPETYAGITRSFLRDIGKVLDQAQADLIIGNINIVDSIYKATGGKGTEAKAWEIKNNSKLLVQLLDLK